MGRVLCGVVLLALVGLPTAGVAGLGTDLAGLHLCLYGDCEARGTYAADPFGWANPATLPVGMLHYMPTGVLVSPGYFRMNSGGVGVNLETITVAGLRDPFVLATTLIYAEASGTPDSMPGTDVTLRLRSLRLLGGVDLGKALGLTGLSAGLIAEVPGLTSDLDVAVGPVPFSHTTEDHEINLTGGLHWRGGTEDWFMVGGFVDGVRNHAATSTPYGTVYTTPNAWVTRVGTSMLPFVPLGLTRGETPQAEWLGTVRLGIDVEYKNVSAPGEPLLSQAVGYFGLDFRALPDAWNPLSDWLRIYPVVGVDTQGGWGVGAGIFGRGPFGFLGCTPSYSSRKRTPSLGDRLDMWVASCGAQIPL